MKIGIVFAGQGAQYSGMGKDLYDSYPEARKVFDTAGEQVKEWCFEGDEETLKQTHVTQPTVYTVSMAAYEAFLSELKKNGLDEKVEISAVAGFSLGEYSALTAAGVIEDIGEGVDIVAKRGVLMKEAGLDENGENKGAMVAGLGKREKILEAVEQAREDGILEGVNFNSPKQTVVAGDKEAIERFCKVAAENKIKAIPLSVSTAFHSPMMVPAAEKLKDVLMEVKLKKPEKTVYADLTADDYMKDYDGGDLQAYLVDIMSKQAMSPVYWEEIIRKFAADGVKAMVEIGPGTTLTGLTKKTCKGIEALNVENVESLSETVSRIKELADGE